MRVVYISSYKTQINMANMKLTLSEQDFREWEAHRTKLITRTKDEIKKQNLIMRNAEACIDRLEGQLDKLENPQT